MLQTKFKHESFVALDVETANADRSSICQIGLACFINGEIVDTYKTLINPSSFFDPFNVEIHGIRPEDVVNAPTFSEIADDIFCFIEHKPCVHHTPFDRVAISSACRRFDISSPEITWIDSAAVARRQWRQFSRSGYGLADLSAYLNFDFKHHDALEDAIACGYVLLHALSESGEDLAFWGARCLQRCTPSRDKRDRLKETLAQVEIADKGPLKGEKILISGSNELSKADAAKIVASLGGEVKRSWSNDVTLVIIGAVEPSVLAAGQNKTAKHQKALESGIPVMSGDDFIEMLYGYQNEQPRY